MTRDSPAVKATDKAVRDYYSALAQSADVGIEHELGLRHAFEALLEHAARRARGWHLAREHSFRRGGRMVRPDGTLLDAFQLPRGWYEAKGPGVDLDREVRGKLDGGYPRENTLFWQPGRIILVQGVESVSYDAAEPTRLVDALRRFLEHEEPQLEKWEEAVREFKDRVPELAHSLLTLIRRQAKSNARFRNAFAEFLALCRAAINPNLAAEAVEEMLIQHLLTERIFRKVFDNADFTRRNAIAAEIETVIDALTSQSFSRHEFLKNLDPFYAAIETTAATLQDFAQKQAFLNTVYEQFFQGFSVKIADTHGIVYTPQPIVNFMVRSVDELLQSEFGRRLADPGVHLLDPFVGTGNFVVRVLRQIADTKKSALPAKYATELHANEVMLLPYYVASMNIEHAYFELAGRYDPFEGICLVDTFELAEDRQKSLFTVANTARVERQKSAPIRVVIGNPPYNVGQLNENDNNKNRKYPAIDQRVRDTYTKDSKASSKSKLDDPYIKAIRWASDRIGEEGIVALVCNSGFLDGIASDGMRKHLAQDFDAIYVLDLGGNVRKNPKISGTTHNVFGIQVGVSVNFFVRRKERTERAEIRYFRVEDGLRREVKLGILEDKETAAGIAWQVLAPDARNNWLTEGMRDEFADFVPLGAKEASGGKKAEGVIFELYTLGVTTARDTWAYNFDREALAVNMARMIDVYNDHVARWPRAEREGKGLDGWVESDEKRIAWSEGLKNGVKRNRTAGFSESAIKTCLLRPFVKTTVYFDPILIERPRQFAELFPSLEAEYENRLICTSPPGARQPFLAVLGCQIVDVCVATSNASSPCFPFYAYDPDGTNRRETVTDWALATFRTQYSDKKIGKWDIFHYVYAVLHHPSYRERYAANLKRELPRVPFAPAFWDLSRAGERLSKLHAEYEQQPEFQLEERWKPGAVLDLRVEKMKFDATAGTIAYNAWLTLAGVPPGVERYRLGHKSALGWVIDQYRVTTDARSGIVNDPNRDDDPRAILRLLGQVIYVSVETVKIVESLPDLGLPVV